MGLNAEKKIYIPEQIKDVSVERLPVSNNLAGLFNELKIGVIGDLQEINAESLNKITGSREKPFSELRHYILAFQESENNEIILIANEQTPVNEFDEAVLKGNSDNLASMLARKIFVPLPAREWKISALPISAELITNLQMSGCARLLDVDGIPYARFSRLKTFKIKDIIELHSFITQLHSTDGFRFVEAKISTVETKTKTDAATDAALPIAEKIEPQRIVPTTENSSHYQTIRTKFDASGTIQTPPSLKDLPFVDLAPSDELEAILRKMKISFVGQLQGISYRELEEVQGFKAENISELRVLLAFANKFSRYTIFSSGFGLIKKAALKRKEGEDATQKSSDKLTELPKIPSEQVEFLRPSVLTGQRLVMPAISTQKFVIPASLKQTPLGEFSLPTKLAGMLGKLGIETIGDLEKISFQDFTRAPFCTAKEKAEFRQLIFQIQNGEIQNGETQTVESSTQHSYFQLEALDLAGLMDFINRFLSKLPPMEKEILIDRFGGSNDEQVLKFETIANKHQTSRERVYQIYVKTFGKLKEKIQHRAEHTLKKLYDDCVSLVCPLTPKFLVHLINDKFELFQYPAAFYIRMFGALLPKLPVLPEIKNQIVTLNADTKKIEREIKSILENSPLPVSLPEIFNRAMVYISNKATAESDFFEAVQSVKFNLIETDNPKELFIEQREVK